MLNVRSLGFRLAVWYFGTVAAVCALAAAGYWLSIRSELNHALDQGLRYRLMGLREFLEDVEPGGNQEITSRLNEISQLGELYQVFDADGTLIAQSRGLARHGFPQRPPEELGFEIRYGAGGTADFPLRLAWPKVTIGSHTLILGVADPQRKFAGVLGAFTTVLLLSTPLILALATACGLWLGRRALAPVARITDDARAIGESNLSARLAVPDSRDELQQLSETLNDMLERIEQSFTRTRQFTAGASHELRAPMTLIHTAAQYSLRRERTREELADGMQKILRESRRTTALIDDLLLLARGDAGRESATLEVMDAGPLLRDAAEQAMAMAAAKDISVSLQLETDGLPVRANEAQLRRRLLILIDNALKYTPSGGRVTIAGSARFRGRTPGSKRGSSALRWGSVHRGSSRGGARAHHPGGPDECGGARLSGRITVKVMSKLIVVTLLVLLGSSPAYAYLDPGTGSILVQGLVAALAVASAAVAAFWTRLRQFFPGRRRPADPEHRDAPPS